MEDLNVGRMPHSQALRSFPVLQFFITWKPCHDVLGEEILYIINQAIIGVRKAAPVTLIFRKQMATDPHPTAAG